MSKMFVVTTTHTSSKPDPEDDSKQVAVHTHESTVQRDVDSMLELMALGHDSLARTRIFEMEIANDGTPKVGKEVKPS